MVFASLLAALMAAGAYLSIPIGPVPMVLQNMFVFLAGLLLGVAGVLQALAYIFWQVLADFPYLPAEWAESAVSWDPPADIF